MAEKRKRGQNFTNDDKDRLIKLISDYKTTILNKKTDGTTNQAKNDAWVSLAARYNSAENNCYRSKESLMKLWEKLRTEAKIYSSHIRRCTTGTGGGPSTIKTDPILSQVCDILGRGCTGIEDVPDSDMDVVTPSTVVIEEKFEEPIILLELKDTEQLNNDLDCDIINDSSSTPNVRNLISTPSATCPWKRRRPILNHSKNERSEAIASVCASFTDVNSRKKELEEIKKNSIRRGT